MPQLAIAAFGLLLSAATRTSAASVVGTLVFALLLQLLGAHTDGLGPAFHRRDVAGD